MSFKNSSHFEDHIRFDSQRRLLRCCTAGQAACFEKKTVLRYFWVHIKFSFLIYGMLHMPHFEKKDKMHQMQFLFQNAACITYADEKIRFLICTPKCRNEANFF